MGDASRESRVSRIVLLGTGTPNAEPDRSGSSVAIVVGDTPYLVDRGPGVVRRATAAQAVGIEALEPKKLTRLFRHTTAACNITGIMEGDRDTVF